MNGSQRTHESAVPSPHHLYLRVVGRGKSLHDLWEPGKSDEHLANRPRQWRAGSSFTFNKGSVAYDKGISNQKNGFILNKENN